MLDRLRRGEYIRLLSAVYFATFLIRAAFGIVVITLKHHVDTGSTMYGLVVAATPFAELLTVIGIGVFIDRYGTRKILIAGLLLGAFSLFTLAFTENVLLLAGINAIHGIASAFILITSLAAIAQHTPKESRGREMGAFNFVNLFGWIAGFAAGVILLKAVSVEWTFIIAGGMAILSALYAWIMVTESTDRAAARTAAAEHGHEVKFSDVVAVLRQRSVVTLVLPWLFVFMFLGGLLNVAPDLVTAPSIPGAETAPTGLDGASGLQALLILALGSVFLVSQLFFGKLSDRYGREPLMIAGAAGFLGFLLTVGFGFTRATSASQADLTAAVTELWPVLFLFVVMILAFPPAALAALADAGQEGKKGITMSLYTLVLAGGLIIGPPATGLFDDAFGHWGVLLFFVVLAALMLAIVAGRYVEGRLTHAARLTPATPPSSGAAPPEPPAAGVEKRAP